MIEKLNWDSEFFKMNIGKLEIYNDNDFDFDEFKKQADIDDYDLIYILKFDSIFSKSNICKSQIRFMDIMVQMSMPFEPDICSSSKYEFRNILNNKELLECYSIAEQIAFVSRFNKEPAIGPELTKKLYRKWIDNTMNGSISDGMFLEKINNKIVGIHTIKNDIINRIGYCSLIGVDNNTKHLGIGKKLWEQSFSYWKNEKIISKIIVPISFQNKASLNFHLKIGFNKIENIKYIYHYKNLRNIQK
jgi:dTDP-4-amino-4,6-dideoxy-D-galactose acyltransferase